MEIKNLEIIVNNFKSKTGPTDRYTSFDYCYNYFRNTINLNQDVEKSCLALGFYLASWGMLRGSSFLLQKSVKNFQNLIEYYASLDKRIWTIDMENYSDDTNSVIIEIYNKSKEKVIPGNNSHLTLITKILLGVFGYIPAFDKYFCKTFSDLFKGKCGFSVINTNSLNCLKEFYELNKISIDKISEDTFTTDFLTERKTLINYPKAKIIDMYGFTNAFS